MNPFTSIQKWTGIPVTNECTCESLREDIRTINTDRTRCQKACFYTSIILIILGPLLTIILISLFVPA